MNAITFATKAPRLGLVFFAIALLVSACGSTVAADRATSLGQPAVVGSSSLDYDTLSHMGLLPTSVGSSSLDYDTLRHIGRLELSECPWSAAGC
jgi:hypothetical protein